MAGEAQNGEGDATGSGGPNGARNIETQTDSGNPSMRGGLTLPDDEPNKTGFVMGQNGVNMKWPPHPGVTGIKGAKLHKEWKQKMKTVKFMKNVDDKSAALLTQMFAQGHSHDLLKEIEAELAKVDVGGGLTVPRSQPWVLV